MEIDHKQIPLLSQMMIKAKFNIHYIIQKNKKTKQKYRNSCKRKKMKKNKSVAFSLHTKLSFKLTVVGGKGSGKTSTIVRYVKNTFHHNYHMTIGIEYYSKVVHLPDDS